MIVPIVLYPFLEEIEYEWLFLKFFNFAYENNMPIIAGEYFFKNPQNEYKIDTRYISGVRTPSYDQILNSDIQKISLSFMEELIIEKGSRKNAFSFIVKNSYKPFKDEIVKALDNIEEKHSTKIKQIILWGIRYKSIDEIAEKRGINVIIMELAPLRRPTFRNLAYFSFDDPHGPNSRLYENYQEFCDESNTNDLPLLCRKEILGLLLSDQYIKYINLLDLESKYKIGFACSSDISQIFFEEENIDYNEKLLNEITNIFSKDEILVRNKKYKTEKILNYIEDDSDMSIEFIAKCESIAMVYSNMLIEAILMGKAIYSLAKKSQLKSFCMKELSDKEKYVVEDKFVNYLIFVHFVPYELINDMDYIEWRLTNPKQTEIFKLHLNYYLEIFNIDKNIFTKTKDKLELILINRGFNRNLVKVTKLNNIHNLRYSLERNENKKISFDYKKKLFVEKLRYNIKDIYKYSFLNERAFAKIYFDYGLGYSEENSKQYFYEEEEIGLSIEFLIENTKNIQKIRFDPIESFFGKFKIEKIIANNDMLKIEALNSDYIEDGFNVFINTDPIYEISGNLNHENKIKIIFQAKEVNQKEVDKFKHKICKENENVIKEKNSIISTQIKAIQNKDMLINKQTEIISSNNIIIKEQIKTIKGSENIIEEQIERIEEYEKKILEYTKSIEKMKKEYNNIINSLSWRLTKPLRVIKRKLSKFIVRG